VVQAVGLQTYIWNNNLRSTLLLIGFPLLLIGMIYVLQLGLMGAGYLPSTGSLNGDLGYSLRLLIGSAPLALVVAGVWFVIAYFSNQLIINLATGAQPVTRKDEPELYNLLENLCISRGMRTPTLQIIETDALNAFASGLHEGQFCVSVTRGLIQTLDRDEIEAVLGHELTHIINRDVRTMVIASVFAGIITLLAQVVYRAVLWGGLGRRSRDDGRRGGNAVFVLLALAVVAVGYALAIVIQFAISRQREYIADAGAVELTKNPDAMISALRKISGRSHLEAPRQVRGMFLENDDEGVMGLFTTHPPVEKRVAALVRFAGGLDLPVTPDRPAVPAAEPPPASRQDQEWPWGPPPPDDGGQRGPWG